MGYTFPERPKSTFRAQSTDDVYSERNPAMWNSCLPDVWGAAAWSYMHCAIETIRHKSQGDKLSDADVGRIRGLLEAIRDTLPCPLCESHFRKHLDGLSDATLRSATAIRQWLIDVHNEVNRSNGKEEVSPEHVPFVLNATYKKEGPSIPSFSCGTPMCSQGFEWWTLFLSFAMGMAVVVLLCFLLRRSR